MNLDTIKVVLNQLRDPNKKSWILLSPSSLGETLCLCSLSESFIKKHGFSITLVIPKTHEFITLCYPNLFHNVLFMTVEEMRLFSSSNIIPRNFFELDFPINTWTNQINDANPKALFELFIKTSGVKGLNFIDMYRYNLRLDWEAPCRLPTLPIDLCDLTSRILIKKFEIKKKFVLIQGGNNTCYPTPSIYFNDICKKLKELDIDVIFNSHGSTFKSNIEALDNIKFLNLSILEATSLANRAITIISGINGFLSFLSALDLNKVIHTFLPNSVLIDPENLIFKEVDPQANSALRALPDLINPVNHILEYQVDEEPNELMRNGVLNSILENFHP